MNNFGGVSRDGWPSNGVIGPFRSIKHAMAEADRQLEIAKAKRDREAAMIRAMRLDAQVSESRAGREL